MNDKSDVIEKRTLEENTHKGGKDFPTQDRTSEH
jgi:hypothetical protein